MLVGIWKHSRLDASTVALGLANAVYASRDSLGRIHRRVTKVDMHGENVEGRAYNAKRTPCSHEDIDYFQLTEVSLRDADPLC